MLMINMFLIYPFMKFWKLSLMFLFSSFFLMMFNMNLFISSLLMSLGLDILSYYLIFLSIFIFSLSVLSSKNIYKINYFYFFLIVFLLKLLMILFLSLNLLYFYILFEFSLIPMMLMILGWGMKVERLQAGIYFIFYTMFSSLPLLYCLMFFMFFNCSSFMLFFNNMIFNYFFKDFFFVLFFNLAFLVKMPVFLFHLWLPKAHVEAPVSGSMILAGILLKLGGYGLIRFFMIIMESVYKYSSFFISFSIWGGLIISFSCLNQLDMKMIVAFSSISHMSLLIGGLYSMNNLGLNGSFFIMIAHGLSSSSLFLLVNIFYERTKSRSLIFNKGFINISPNLALSSFLIISSSMASPPTVNLLSEFLLTYSLAYYFNGFLFILFFLMLMSICYSMYMYSFNLHGKLFSGLYFFKKILCIEYFLIFVHWFPSNLLIMKSEIFMFM